MIPRAKPQREDIPFTDGWRTDMSFERFRTDRDRLTYEVTSTREDYEGKIIASNFEFENAVLLEKAIEQIIDDPYFLDLTMTRVKH